MDRIMYMYASTFITVMLHSIQVRLNVFLRKPNDSVRSFIRIQMYVKTHLLIITSIKLNQSNKLIYKRQTSLSSSFYSQRVEYSCYLDLWPFDLQVLWCIVRHLISRHTVISLPQYYNFSLRTSLLQATLRGLISEIAFSISANDDALRFIVSEHTIPY